MRKAICTFTFVGQHAVMGCSYRIPTALGQGVFVGILNILTNIYFYKQKSGGRVLRRVSAISLILCGSWDAYSASVYIQFLRDANTLQFPFMSAEIKDELVQFIYRGVDKVLIFHAIESVVCGYLLIILFITSKTYQYAEGN